MRLTESLVEEVHGCRRDDIPADVLNSDKPLLLRGLVEDWPLVKRAREDAHSALVDIAGYYQDKPVSLFLGPPEIGGRFFYNDEMDGFNFVQMEANLNDVFGKLAEYESADPSPTFYVGSTAVDTWLPGFRRDNDIALDHLNPLHSIWLGNQSRVAAHFDFPSNIACCAVGRRRFTVFPPEQLDNLYVGPMDLTPAGQQISLVDFAAVDYQQFPRFSDAVAAAQVAELNPGDALYLPGMWWHHVEALDPINVLVNYWWRPSPDYLGSPSDALNHALLALKSLSPAQRQAWKHLFDFYVFGDSESHVDHIPEQARGRLGEIDNKTARRLRAELLNRLKQ